MIAQGAETIKEDKYVWVEFVLYKDTSVSVESRLKSGPRVDVYLMDEKAFNIWTTTVASTAIGYHPLKHYFELGIEGLSLSSTSKWRALTQGVSGGQEAGHSGGAGRR